MGRQITFHNDLSAQYCQIKYEDGKRILISVAEGEVKIFSLKLFSLFPNKTLYSFNIMKLFENEYYQKILQQLHSVTTIKPKWGFNQLDVFRKVLLPCTSIKEAEEVLDRFDNGKEAK